MMGSIQSVQGRALPLIVSGDKGERNRSRGFEKLIDDTVSGELFVGSILQDHHRVAVLLCPRLEDAIHPSGPPE